MHNCSGRSPTEPGCAVISTAGLGRRPVPSSLIGVTIATSFPLQLSIFGIKKLQRVFDVLEAMHATRLNVRLCFTLSCLPLLRLKIDLRLVDRCLSNHV